MNLAVNTPSAADRIRGQIEAGGLGEAIAAVDGALESCTSAERPILLGLKSLALVSIGQALEGLRVATHARELAALELCLKSLPEPQGRLVREHYFAATSLTEIARQDGKREVAVRVALFRARLWLRACIARRLGSGPLNSASETSR